MEEISNSAVSHPQILEDIFRKKENCDENRKMDNSSSSFDSDEITIIETVSSLSNPVPLEDEEIASFSDINSDDDEWGVVNLSDEDEVDEEEQMRRIDASKPMVCHRCPSVKAGTFKDKAKYFFHIKRHIFGGHFCCPTCRRPFVQISHCVSHEIRVHGADIPYDKKNRVVSFAKKYASEKRIKQAKKIEVVDLDLEDDDNKGVPASNEGNGSTGNQENEEGYETDPEDVKFYNNRVIASNALMQYQGPPVNHFLECYEIHLNHARKKSRRIDFVAKDALSHHRWNVQHSQDTFRLGRFSKRKERAPKVLYKLPCELDEEEEAAAAAAAAAAKNSNDSGDGNKRPRDADDSSSDETQVKPKPKKRRVVYSSSDNSDDSDFIPIKSRSRKKSQKSQVLNSTTTTTITKLKSAIKYPTKKVLPALVDRKCRKCSYVWSLEADLRAHRDELHPGCTLIDLMSVPADPGIPPIKKKVTFNIEEKEEKDDDMFIPIKVTKKKTNVKLSEPSHAIDVNGRESGQEKPKQASTGASRLQLKVPEIDKTFTEKERFLYTLGLVQKVRLTIQKPEVKLKSCSVELTRLTPEATRIITI